MACLKIGIIVCLLIAQILTEQCFTPNNETAECIPLYSCPILIGALASQQRVSIEFVSESNCGGTGKNPLVCCGSSSNFTTAKDSTIDQSKNVSKISLLPSDRYCGYQHSDDYYRPANDTSIRINEFPWLARIKFKSANPNDTLKNKFVCIGSLINRRYVLTAAHCLVNLEEYVPEEVQLGEYNVKNKTDCVQDPPFEEECSEAVQEIAIEKLIVHPIYSARKKFHDISLIRLAKNVAFSDYVRPICLPFPERAAAKVEDTVISTGWGKANYDEDYVEIKKKIFSSLISKDECHKQLNKVHRVQITDNQLCAVPFGNNTHFECQGDSGGPVMFSHNNQWQLEGIISYGIGCGTSYPDVYTYVKKYLDWILYVIEP